VTLALQFQVPAVALVAHQAFIALAQLLTQVGHDGLPVMGVLAALFLVEAYDVATIFYPHVLQFERSGIFRMLPFRHALKPAPPMAQHLGTDLFLPAHPHPDDVADRGLMAFEGGQGGLADHAPVGHHRNLPQAEAAPQPFNDRHQGGDVGGIARPHLAADRVALHVQGQTHHHLAQVGPMVLVVAPFAQALPTFAFKVKAGGVEKD
jgi:hypothetical protein